MIDGYLNSDPHSLSSSSLLSFIHFFKPSPSLLALPLDFCRAFSAFLIVFKPEMADINSSVPIIIITFADCKDDLIYETGNNPFEISAVGFFRF